MITCADVYVPARPGPWCEFIVAAENNGIDQPAATACGTTECGHAVGSYHYLLLALDRGACVANAAALWDLFEPYAQGPDRVIDELFLDCRGGYKRGVSIGPIGGHACCESGDPNAHLHAALRPGFHLPNELLYPIPDEERELMAVKDEILFGTMVCVTKDGAKTRALIRRLDREDDAQQLKLADVIIDETKQGLRRLRRQLLDAGVEPEVVEANLSDRQIEAHAQENAAN